MKKQYLCLSLILSLLSKVLVFANTIDYPHSSSEGIKHFSKVESYEEKKEKIKKIKHRLEGFMGMVTDNPRLDLLAANLGCQVIALVDNSTKIMYFDECFYDLCTIIYKSNNLTS